MPAPAMTDVVATYLVRVTIRQTKDARTEPVAALTNDEIEAAVRTAVIAATADPRAVVSARSERTDR